MRRITKHKKIQNRKTQANWTVPKIKHHSELSKDIIGDGQTFRSGLVLSTESTTDLFTKHLCGAERVHGKERPGGRQGLVVVGSGAVGRCLARQGQRSQRECGQPECNFFESEEGANWRRRKSKFRDGQRTKVQGNNNFKFQYSTNFQAPKVKQNSSTQT